MSHEHTRMKKNKTKRSRSVFRSWFPPAWFRRGSDVVPHTRTVGSDLILLLNYLLHIVHVHNNTATVLLLSYTNSHII